MLKLCKMGIKPPRGEIAHGRSELQGDRFGVDSTSATEVEPSMQTLRKLLQDPSPVPHTTMGKFTKSRSRIQSSPGSSANSLRIWACGSDAPDSSPSTASSSVAPPSVSVPAPYPAVPSCPNSLEDLNTQTAIFNSMLGSAAAPNHLQGYSVDTPPQECTAICPDLCRRT